jgi:DNA-damage-inducible protein J
MTTLNIRIDPKLKSQAKKVYSSLGLDISTAVKMFLTQSVTEQAIPFKLRRDPKDIVAEWNTEIAWALKHGKRYKTGKEVFADFKV